ncbi:NAD-dependent epimerase/dehydratase family protein [Burkholderia diffusa]|uniref:NAD-dependent epimerase/dehydratase family protein n=1 Tax=Burkholderia diffusa TaxID=488732 RepID=UPI00075A53BA|nr:SDR family oxidoreductase [Burkholderia diffusa]KVN06950.1 oxidoreductase [Burkholderia diffusa]
MKILVTGACGYKGSVLVPKLLARAHQVLALDTQWFGNSLAPHAALTTVKGDVREVSEAALEGIQAVIHLASVANDPCGELNPALTWEISALATQQLADRCVRAGVPRFIYASSGSVYGIRDEPQVTETLPLTPVSVYNKAKMVAERVLASYTDRMVVQIVRPATVCGLSPRMRLDVAVNLLTAQAVTQGRITVLGGAQVRPNIHIDDLAELYCFLLEHPEFAGVYNAGFENLSILDIAERVARHIPAAIDVRDSNDPRSYRMNAEKLLATGFVPKKCVEDAIIEVATALVTGQLQDEPRHYNVQWMQRQGVA